MPSVPSHTEEVRSPVFRFGAAALLGALSGGLLHRVAVWSSPEHPTGWRAVATDAADPAVDGLAPQAGSWSLRHRTMWYSRASLPGRGLRTLVLDASIPRDGLLDIWLARRTTEQPGPGDLLLRLHSPETPAAQMFTWDDQGPRPVSCAPALQLSDTIEHAVGIEAAEGLLSVTLDGKPSTCAAVGGTNPPALQSGWRGVRVARLAIDGRSVPPPNPGPLPLWVFLGGFLALGVARLEHTSGAAHAITLSGDLLVLGSVAGALWFVPTAPGGGFIMVIAPVAIAAFVRLSLHITRALRPLAHRSDWTSTAATAAVIPTVGLWLLAVPTEVPSAFQMGVLSLAFGGAALTLAQWKRPTPWRAFTLMAAIVSLATLLARVFGGPSLPVICTGTAVGLAAAASAGLASRFDRRPLLRILPFALVLGAALCATELNLSAPPSLGPSPRSRPDHPIAVLSMPASGGILVSGPLALSTVSRGRQSLLRLQGLPLPLHPVGDGSWGPPDFAAALQQSPMRRPPPALILTASPILEDRPIHGGPGWFPGVRSAMEDFHSQSPDQKSADLLGALDAIAATFAPSPVVLVSGTSGPDAAPARRLQSAFQSAAEAHGHVHHVDFADRVEQHPAEGWISPRGMLTERAWDELGVLLQPLLEHP